MNASRRYSLPFTAPALGSALAMVAGLTIQFAAFSAEPRGELKSITVQASTDGNAYSANASVEAVRDTRVASQVAGRITELAVKAGDHVQSGQILLRIDPSVAAQQVVGSQAQAAQAQAMLTSARGDYDRAQHLYKKEYLSKAALQHAEAQFKAAEAQARALNAQASVTSVQASYYTVRAPYAGWVAGVDVSVGDTAAPGMPLLSLFDPSALRVTAQVPESVVSRIDTSVAATVELPNASAGQRRQKGARTTVLPSLDAATHSATVRVDLAQQPSSVLPGQFAQIRLPLKSRAEAAGNAAGRVKLMVPAAAVVERGELVAVYVVTAQGHALLRQVRLGQPNGDLVEVLAGLVSGEKVALDPVAAAQALTQ